MKKWEWITVIILSVAILVVIGYFYFNMSLIGEPSFKNNLQSNFPAIIGNYTLVTSNDPCNFFSSSSGSICQNYKPRYAFLTTRACEDVEIGIYREAESLRYIEVAAINFSSKNLIALWQSQGRDFVPTGQIKWDSGNSYKIGISSISFSNCNNGSRSGISLPNISNANPVLKKFMQLYPPNVY